MIEKRWLQENRSGLFKLALGGLAVFGGITLLDRLGSRSDEDYSYDKENNEEDE